MRMISHTGNSASKPIFANHSDKSFRELCEFLGIPPNTSYYRLSFRHNEPVEIEWLGTLVSNPE